MDELELPKRNVQGIVRMPILDKMKDRGVVVFSKIESGIVEMG
jgi:translation elongation factor EF-1alpha